MPTGSPARSTPSSAEAAMGGNHAAIQAIWLEHRRWLAAIILAYKPQLADLEDLLQEVAMTLVAKGNTVRDQANLRAWLRTVAINVARAAGRSARLRPIAKDSFDLDNQFSANPCLVEQSDHSQHVMNFIAELPEIYREPLVLKAQGFRTRQIAEILEIQEAAVDTRVSRARKMLRDMMDGNHIPEISGNTNGHARKNFRLNEVNHD